PVRTLERGRVLAGRDVRAADRDLEDQRPLTRRPPRERESLLQAFGRVLVPLDEAFATDLDAAAVVTHRALVHRLQLFAVPDALKAQRQQFGGRVRGAVHQADAVGLEV